MRGRPGRPAAAETEPQRTVCKDKAAGQHRALVLQVCSSGVMLSVMMMTMLWCTDGGGVSPERHGCCPAAQAERQQWS